MQPCVRSTTNAPPQQRGPRQQGFEILHHPILLGTAEEIAGVLAFLASDEASYITGQTIYACGGVTLFGEFRENWAS